VTALQRTDDGPVVRLTIDNPPLNAVNRDLYHSLIETFVQLHDAPDVAVVVLGAAGRRAFSAGADLAEIEAANATDPDGAADFAAWRRWAAHEVVRLISTAPMATMAAVNAAAVGIGASMALACDFRIAATTATFSFPEVKLGSLGGVSELAAANLSHGWHRYLVLTGEPVDATTAFHAGLIQRVVPAEDLSGTASALARRMVTEPVDRIRASKAALIAASGGPR
jgi:enoyl-CoA hydratase/carnithine racemase